VTAGILNGSSSNSEFIETVDRFVRAFCKKQHVAVSSKTPYVQIISEINSLSPVSVQVATIVAATATLLEYYSGKQFELDIINKLSFQIEKNYFHFSLGFFSSCSCFGGLHYYRKEFEFLKSVSRLNFKIPDTIQKNLYVMNSINSEESLPSPSIEAVKKMYNQNPILMEEIFNKLEKATKRLVVAIAQESSSLFETTFKIIKELEDQIIIEGLSSGIELVYTQDLKSVEEKYQRESNWQIEPFQLSETGLIRLAR
jgi:mevalonate kinase